MVSLALVNDSHHSLVIKWFLPCLTTRLSLTWLDSYYGSRDGDQDRGSSFIYLGYVELLNIHDCKHRSIDDCVYTVYSVDIDL